MADTGWRNPGTVVNDSAVGSGAWLNPDNAKTSNDLDSTATAALTYYLKATNFGFSIPDGATINGIEVGIEKASKGADQADDYRVQIVKATGAFGTQNKAKAGYWTITDTYYTYGGSSDLWGESWTPANINDVDFGVGLSANIGGFKPRADVDHVRIKVYYTEVALTNMKINIGDVFKDVDEIKVNIADVWKPVSGIWINIGDAWKKVFG